MDQTLKWGTPSPKLKLFQFLVLAGLFYFSSGIIKVTKTVKDTAVLSCDYNLSTDELTTVRIYWQKGDKVVLSVISGEVKVWADYENRTSINIADNLSIEIQALHLLDNGTYTCVIQKYEKRAFTVKHLISVMLLVRADFPVPNITDLGNPSANIKRINCSASGGFPKPHLSWLENGKQLNAVNTTVSQDPKTKLYTISSELDFNVTNNHSFVCLVKYGNLTVSQTFKWQKAEIPVPYSQSWTWTLIAISVCGGGVIVLCCLCNGLAARRRRRRRNAENIEMERISPIYSGSAGVPE